jgi:glycosyltransferase involved in cell wall biosynthesis
VAFDTMTFTTPHQRETSGGVYVIEQLARKLAATVDTTLLVRRGPVRPIPGVRVRAAGRLSASTVPRADVLVGGVAQGTFAEYAALPPSCGQQVFLFQGYGTPGDARVRNALAERPRLLTVSDWLAVDAQAHGCRVAQFRYGLDRSLFFPGRACEERPPVVAMMCHTLDWKGGADGLAALTRVRDEVPEVELRLFGTRAPEFAGNIITAPSRERVGAIFREAAVVACPSWEEGFGLPGLEALACGAALATTDTKGSRDYAYHEATALVSPPREPGELAANIVRLLDDRELRGRLALAGSTAVRERFPPWEQAAQRFVAAVTELVS